MGKGLEDATRNLLLEIHGLSLKSMGGFQALPVFRRRREARTNWGPHWCVSR